MATCAKCGIAVHVLDGEEFEYGDMCNSCLQSAYDAAKEAWEQMRESILNERFSLAENGMTSDQINDVLENIDYFCPFAPCKNPTGEEQA